MLYHRSLARRIPLALTWGLVALVAGTSGIQAQAQVPLAPNEDQLPEQSPEPEPSSGYLRPTQLCPDDLPVLATELLNDLPSYANRVASRSLNLTHLSAPTSTVLVASRPDLNPIDLAELAPNGIAQSDAALHQVFFTTLERQFRPDRTVSLHHYHWLFLAQGPEGWYMAMLYSSLGAVPTVGSGRPPTPPQESSDGIVGQAVRLWLRDCRAGAVFSTEVDPADAATEGRPSMEPTYP